MHAAARAFVERWASTDLVSVVEIGSRNVNGEIRDLWPNATWYHGLDLHAGPGVDTVCDACEYAPPHPVDVVVCCEVLEHSQNWQGIVLNACSWLRPGGRLIVTCAGAGRKSHSAIDGEAVRPEEWYANLLMWELVPCITGVPGMRILVSEYDPQLCDCRVVAEMAA